MLARLRVLKGPQRGVLFPVLNGATTLIGRSPSNPIVLPDPGVSSIHCLLAPGTAAGRFVLIDARSRSGLLVKGKPFTKGEVAFGDVLTVGPFELELVPAGKEGAAAGPVPRVAKGPCLYEVGQAGQRKRVPLQVGGATMVGRGEYADVRLEDGRVSEYHCILAMEAAPDDVIPIVIDLYSANHTYVNGRAIHRKHVMPGHLIAVGKTEFEIRRASAPAPQAAPAPPRAALRHPSATASPQGAGSSRQEAGSSRQTAGGRRREAGAIPLAASDSLRAENGNPLKAETMEAEHVGPPLPTAVRRLPTAARAVAPAPPPPAKPAPSQGPRAVALADLGSLDELTEGYRASQGQGPGVALVPDPGEQVRSRQEAVGSQDPEPPHAGAPPVDSRLPAAERLQPAQDAVDYWTSFGLPERPFGNTLNPHYFYHSRCHWGAFVALNRWVENGPPLAVLYGEHGSGKTFLASCLAQRLALIDPRTVLIRPTKQVEKRDDLILAAVLGALERYGEPSAKGRSSLDVWHALLAEIRRRRSLFAFLIDDAQEFAPSHLQALGELLENEDVRGVVRVLLTGEERLRDIVTRPPLSNHLGVSCYLSPMDAQEVAGYVAHRLNVASDDGKSLFTPRAIQLVTTYSGGIPRLINKVADAALAYASRCRLSQVSHEVVSQAIEELLRREPVSDEHAGKLNLS